MNKLKDKVAIVTGAGAGMGAAYAKLFASEGAKVVIAEYDEKNGKQVESEIKQDDNEATFIQCDVSNHDDVKRVVKQTIDTYGSIEILVNNAQFGGSFHPIEDFPTDLFIRQWETGMYGTYLFCKECLPYMKENNYGRIVNVGSNAGVTGIANGSGYNSNKEAIRGFSRTLANEYGVYGITCNVICPVAMTPMAAQLKETQPDLYNQILEEVPLRYLGDPAKDIAPVVLFLVSDDARFVTGQTIGVDGGKTKL